jgi:alkaline phosphatase
MKAAKLFLTAMLAKYVAKELGFDLNKANSRLFVEVGDVFSKNEYMLNMTYPSKPCAENRKPTTANRQNILIKNGKTHELEGIVTYAPETGRIYIPAEAVPLVKGT